MRTKFVRIPIPDSNKSWWTLDYVAGHDAEEKEVPQVSKWKQCASKKQAIPDVAAANSKRMLAQDGITNSSPVDMHQTGEIELAPASGEVLNRPHGLMPNTNNSPREPSEGNSSDQTVTAEYASTYDQMLKQQAKMPVSHQTPTEYASAYGQMLNQPAKMPVSHQMPKEYASAYGQMLKQPAKIPVSHQTPTEYASAYGQMLKQPAKIPVSHQTPTEYTSAYGQTLKQRAKVPARYQTPTERTASFGQMLKQPARKPFGDHQTVHMFEPKGFGRAIDQ